MLPLNGELEQIYGEYRQQLFTCAVAITRCPDRAEDAVQEAFYRLYRLNVSPQNLKAYVFRTVRNAALDQARKETALPSLNPQFVFDPQPDPCDFAKAEEFQQQVAAAMTALSRDECETIVQHLYGNLTFREISQIREAPLGTVTAWYQRGLQKLRTELEE